MINTTIYQILKKTTLFLFILFCLIFPAADLIISKKLLFACNVLFVIIDFVFEPEKEVLTKSTLFRIITILTIVIVFSIPTYWKNPAEVTFVIVSCLTLIISFSAHNYKSFFFKSFLLSANILAALTVFIGLISLYSKIIEITVNSVFLALDSGFLGYRDFGPLKLTMVHFRTAPVLIIPFSFYFIKLINKFSIKNILLFLLHAIAVVFTASRGTILFSLLSLFFICLKNLNNKRFRFLFFTFIMLGGIGLSYILTQTNALSSDEKSNSVKIGHLESFSEYMEQEPLILLTGKGTASYYYTKGFGRYAWQTEVTYLDLIRYFGLFITFIFLLTIMMPTRKTTMNIPFIMFFIDATTNPLIFASTGMLVISLYYILQEGVPLFNNNLESKRRKRNDFLRYCCSL